MPLTRSLALLTAFGTLANSLRSNSASVLLRTLLRCSARPNGGGIPHGSSASRTSPEWLVRCAHFAGVGVSSFLYPHSSQGHGTPCPYTLPPPTGQPQGLPLRLIPHPSLLRPHSSLLSLRSRKVSNPPATPHKAIRAMPSSDCASGICPKASQPPRMPRPICKYI